MKFIPILIALFMQSGCISDMPAPITEVLEVITAGRSTFTIDNAVNDVPITTETDESRLINKALNYLFTPKDNILVVAVGIKLPYAFCASTEPFRILINWHRYSDQAVVAEVVAFWLPTDGEEISLSAGSFPGFFSNFPTDVDPTEKYYLTMAVSNGRVSMIYNPSTNFPDDTELNIRAFARIQHQIELVGASWPPP